MDRIDNDTPDLPLPPAAGVLALTDVLDSCKPFKTPNRDTQAGVHSANKHHTELLETLKPSFANLLDSE